MNTETDGARDLLRADPAFRHAFLSAASDETAADLVAQRGWALPLEEVRALRATDSPADNELSEAELGMISGGTSGVLKSRHETAKNAIGNVR